MPWKELKPMEQRIQFTMKVKEGRLAFAKVCHLYGISRKTGYKWWNRYQNEGLPGLGNEVWAADFKGWFNTGDGQRCDPLTISDLATRYLLCCKVCPDQKEQTAKAVFEKVFAEYGLPEVMRVDNGSPFGSRSCLGLSKLSVWWIRLGIRVEFIEPGQPQQNGCHERMHKTLKAETTKPASKSP
jgi:transposase InsO family protein